MPPIFRYGGIIKEKNPAIHLFREESILKSHAYLTVCNRFQNEGPQPQSLVAKKTVNLIFWDWAKFKAFADNKLNAVKIQNSVFDRVENIVGKGENAVYQHFLVSHNIFKS